MCCNLCAVLMATLDCESRDKHSVQGRFFFRFGHIINCPRVQVSSIYNLILFSQWDNRMHAMLKLGLPFPCMHAVPCKRRATSNISSCMSASNLFRGRTITSGVRMLNYVLFLAFSLIYLLLFFLLCRSTRNVRTVLAGHWRTLLREGTFVFRASYYLVPKKNTV